MILLIDNYDSFTWNLVQGLGRLGAQVRVVRNDRIDVAAAERSAPERLLISPGPGSPSAAGASADLIRAFAGRIPVLGVCLGHQCIAEVFGGRVVPAPRLLHGKTSLVHHDGRGIFRGLPDPFEAMRYHSLIVDAASLPGDLEVTARTDDGEVMGIRHARHPVEGVQFHPESYLTEEGLRILENFLRM